AGHPAFDDRAHDFHLMSRICDGLRPQLLQNIPSDCAQMMQKCWDVDPSKRPTIRNLWTFAENKLRETINNSSNSDDNGSNSGDGSSSSNPLQVHTSHPLAYHTSRILNDEIAKSKSFKSNDSLLGHYDINFSLSD